MAIERTRNYRKLAQTGLEQLDAWEGIASTKKESIITEWASFFAAQEREVTSKLDKARHLLKAQTLLGHGNFDAAAKVFGLNYKTAYRLISMAEKVEKALPPYALALAPSDLGGIDPKRPFGDYQDAIDALPPPKHDDPIKIRDWWQKIMEKKAEAWGERHKGKTRPKEMVRVNLYLSIRRVLRQAAPKYRVEIFADAVGMTLAELGITSPTKFEPKAIPADYVPRVGRPRKDGKKEE